MTEWIAKLKLLYTTDTRAGLLTIPPLLGFYKLVSAAFTVAVIGLCGFIALKVHDHNITEDVRTAERLNYASQIAEAERLRREELAAMASRNAAKIDEMERAWSASFVLMSRANDELDAKLATMKPTALIPADVSAIIRNKAISLGAKR